MLLIMGCMCLFWQINWLPMLFSALAVQALGYGLDSLVSGIFCTVTGISLSALLQSRVGFTLLAFTSKGALLAACVWLRHLILQAKKLRADKRGWVRMLLPTVALLLLSVFILEYLLESRTITAQLSTTILFAVSFAILYIGSGFRAHTFLALFEKNEQTLLQQNTEQRAVLHDTTNILLAIDGLLENGQQEQALALTRQLTEHCTPATRYVSTQNPTVDAVLNDQCAKAAAAGIQLFIEVCSLQNLAMQDLDIVILFPTCWTTPATPAWPVKARGALPSRRYPARRGRSG